MFSVRVEGLAEIEKTLRQLPDATARNVMRRTLVQAAEPVAAMARQLAPVRQGGQAQLRESIEVTTRLSRRQRQQHQRVDPSDVEVFIGAGPLPHAHMQEFGTQHHGPQPFLRPAWDSKRVIVLDSIKRILWAEIEKAVGRAERKAAKAAGG